MANESIKKAFQRFWEHTLNKIDDKVDKEEIAYDNEALEDIAELGLLEVMHHDNVIY